MVRLSARLWSLVFVVLLILVPAHLTIGEGDDTGSASRDSSLLVSVLFDFGDGRTLWGQAQVPVDNATAQVATEVAAAGLGLQLEEAEFPGFGSYLQSVDGVQQPSDFSRFWQLLSYNESGWHAADVGMSGLAVTNGSTIGWFLGPYGILPLVDPQHPYAGVANVTVLLDFGDGRYDHRDAVIRAPNGTALEATRYAAALANWQLDLQTFSFGTFVSGIAGVQTPEDFSRSWSLVRWHQGAWETSSVGSDALVLQEGDTIAWQFGPWGAPLPLSTPSDPQPTVAVGHLLLDYGNGTRQWIDVLARDSGALHSEDLWRAALGQSGHAFELVITPEGPGTDGPARLLEVDGVGIGEDPTALWDLLWWYDLGPGPSVWDRLWWGAYEDSKLGWNSTANLTLALVHHSLFSGPPDATPLVPDAPLDLPPVFDSPTSLTIVAGTPTTFFLQAHDPEGSENLLFALVSAESEGGDEGAAGDEGAVEVSPQGMLTIRTSRAQQADLALLVRINEAGLLNGQMIGSSKGIGVALHVDVLPPQPKDVILRLGPLVDADGRPLVGATLRGTIDGVAAEGRTDAAGEVVLTFASVPLSSNLTGSWSHRDYANGTLQPLSIPLATLEWFAALGADPNATTWSLQLDQDSINGVAPQTIGHRRSVVQPHDSMPLVLAALLVLLALGLAAAVRRRQPR